MNSFNNSILDILAKPGIHEVEVSKHFPVNPPFSAEFPVFKNPLTIMAFTNRCGSNLLADYLNQTSKIGGFHESLNHDTIRRMSIKESIENFPDYITYIFKKFSVDGRLGVKASWDQITMLSRSGTLKMFPAVNIIHIKRSDVVSQAVSHWIAHQTKKWTSAQKGDATDPIYDFKSIDRIVSSINNSNSIIPILSDAIGANFAEILYEDVVRDPYCSVISAGRSLSLDLSDWTPISPKIYRQADQVNNEFIFKFNSELRRVIGV